MSTCVLHIGMHKTGSTSIQASLQHFQDQHFVYADLGRAPNHSHAIYDAFTLDGERGFFDVKPEQVQVDRYTELLLQAIAANGERNLLISGEKISVMHPAALQRLQNFLSPHFQQIKVVGYVRPPASYIASAFQQRLKNRNPSFAPLRLYRSYVETFQRFDDIFGRDNVELWKFDGATLYKSCAVSDFCRRTAIELPDSRITNKNESMSRQFVGLLYVYRKFAPDLAATLQLDEVERLNNSLATVWSDKFYLSPRLTQAIHVHHAADIAWMESRLNDSLQEAGRSSDSQSIDDEADLLNTPAQTVQQLRALVGRKISRQYTNTPEHIAQLFHALRTSAPFQAQPPTRSNYMTSLRHLFRR
ncbi:MAG: hypothetical protein ACRCTL_06630 [Pseudomonas sp.]